MKQNMGPIGIGVAVLAAIILLIFIYRANFAPKGPPPDANNRPAYSRGTGAAPYGPNNHPGGGNPGGPR